MAETIKIGELVYKVTGDTSGLKASLKDVELKAVKSGKGIEKGFGSKLKGMFGAIAAAAIGSKIVSFFSSAAKAASDAEETANKFGVVFKDIAKTANDTAKEIANGFGLASHESKKFLADTGDLLTGFGFTQEAALGLSEEVVKLGLDLSSFANVDQQFAVEGLRKALLGETEQAKSLGIVINQTTKEFRDAVKQKQKDTGATLQQAKAQVILEQATKQSKNAIGDFARSADSAANVSKRVGARLTDIKVEIGNQLIPALSNLGLAFLNASKDGGVIADALKTISSLIANVINGFAKLINTIDTSSKTSALEETGEQLEENTRKIRELRKEAEILGFNGFKDLKENAGEFDLKAKDLLTRFQELNKEGQKLTDNSVDQSTELQKNFDLAKKLAEEAKREGKALQDNIRQRETQRKTIKASGKESKKSISAEEKAWIERNKAVEKYVKIAAAGQAQINNLLAAGGALVDAMYQKRIDQLDANMEAELRAAGVAEETTVEQAQREYDAAVATGDALAIEEKRRALEKATIEEKYAKKRAQLEYKGALASWQFQMATAAAGIPIATLQGLITGWGAGWPLGMVLGPLFAGLSGAAAGLQLAAVAVAKPQPPKFATGGIVPGSSYTGDSVTAQVNSGEMVLNSAQQRQLFNMANGGGNGGMNTVNLILDGTVLGKILYSMSKNGDMLIDAGAITTK